MVDRETMERKQSALRTMLEIMEVPEFRHDVTKMHNVRWLSRNLRSDRDQHPLLNTAMDLVIWILKNNRQIEDSREKPD
ncbi:MAG TPA: hypothetical protein EYQ00_11245 [Dehalococcoidia bacterium]|jgi:hypothetical protein|nr:hypothetical protein [Dehalococcoidia bacterium]